MGYRYTAQNLMFTSQISRIFENNLLWSMSVRIWCDWIASKQDKKSYKTEREERKKKLYKHIRKHMDGHCAELLNDFVRENPIVCYLMLVGLCVWLLGLCYCLTQFLHFFLFSFVFCCCFIFSRHFYMVRCIFCTLFHFKWKWFMCVCVCLFYLPR